MTNTEHLTTPLLRGEDVGKQLNLHPREARRLLARDGVPILRITQRTWRVAEPDFRKWLSRRMAQPTSPVT